MPEIAEVEFARRHLVAWTRGKSLVKAVAHDPKRIEGTVPVGDPVAVTGWVRQGKMLLARFADGSGMLNHLGMTGKWVRNPGLERRHVRLELFLSDSSSVALIDPRRFGWTAFGHEDGLKAQPRWSGLGPDCLDEAWDGERFARLCGSSRQAFKDRLMNQKVIAGLGNIALVEMAFRAKLHPHRLCDSLAKDEWSRLSQAMDAHIDYVLNVEDGEEIRYQSEKKSGNPFVCYGRENQPCPNCKTPFVRVVHRGRPTFYCPTCQSP
jgi:formamidopyrimidine-DNA glycosylase